MLRWLEAPFLSQNNHLLGRLPREVSREGFLALLFLTNIVFRVNLSSIRSMAKCPCPRCLTPKDLLDQLGTKHDQSQRVRLARLDNLQYRVKISNARDIIYEQNRSVDSKFVDNILGDESLVPTQARLFF